MPKEVVDALNDEFERNGFPRLFFEGATSGAFCVAVGAFLYMIGDQKGIRLGEDHDAMRDMLQQRYGHFAKYSKREAA